MIPPATGRSGTLRPAGAWRRPDSGTDAGPARRGLRGWGWLAALTALLLLAAVLVMLGGSEERLAQLALEGTRGPVCERIVLLADQSGSMTDMAAARDTAQVELLDWLPRNLRPEDELAIIDFASSAQVRLTPTRMADLTSGAGRIPEAVSQDAQTLLNPAVDAVGDLPATPCDVDVFLLSDGQLADLPADSPAGDRLLLDRRIHDLRLLVPSEGDVVPQQWRTAFPTVVPDTFDGLDAEAGALAIGEAVASSTGQYLAR